MNQTTEGYIIDTETGEVLGHTETDELVEDRERLVDWALKKRADAIAEAAGIEAHMNLLVAGIKERLETRIAECKRKADWIETAYGATIRNWAEDNLPAGKKSIKHDWATVGFRSSRESTKVLDESAALEFCLENFPDAVKVTRSVLVSGIPAEAKPALPSNAFEFHSAGETQEFYIN